MKRLSTLLLLLPMILSTASPYAISGKLLQSFLTETSFFVKCNACKALLPIARLLVRNTNNVSSLNLCSILPFIDRRVCDSLLTTYEVMWIKREEPCLFGQLCYLFWGLCLEHTSTIQTKETTFFLIRGLSIFSFMIRGPYFWALPKGKPLLNIVESIQGKPKSN